MQPQKAYQMIEDRGLVAGMRGDFSVDVALETTATLMDAGINVFELTMNSVEPLAAMQAVKRAYGDDACVGMGTVLDVDTANRVLDAGADFVVSPAFQPDVVEAVQAADILIAPGVTTPTEAVHAWEMGVELLKVFPIGALGLDYFKAMFGPLNHMKFMCNGGMHAENVRQFLSAGAVACGMASWLTGSGTLDQDVIKNRAKQLRDAVNEARGIPRHI